ncbi:MAG: aminotransferase class V-fold PLP-dependent enzyme [candidate division Zixibacteria bacterium]|nr:aminotransferase class V-fold PLP-dependent enzyme [candidate division Zixibacteria bacterium]
MAIPLLDLTRQNGPIRDEINEAISRVLDHNKFILGPEVAELEKKVSEYSECKHGIGVASGTDSLLISLRSAGVEPGDEVITTSFTFFATAGVITRVGAIPVFVDILPDTFNLDPDLIESAITGKTKVIMPVHLYGQCADMDRINEIAKKHNLAVVEDAAQAIGAKYKGKKAGSMGDLGCFSFFPSKNLGACGDAGMIVTNDDSHEEMCRKLRVHGSKPKYYHSVVGYNSRLDTLQAAILGVKFNYLEGWHEGRREKARKYNELFTSEKVKKPFESEDCYHIYHQYTIRVPERDALAQHLKEKGIGHAIYYPLPLHSQECYRELGYKEGDLPETESAAREVISIPIFPEMTDEEQKEVVSTIEGFYK